MTYEKMNYRLPRRARFIHHATCADHTQRWQGDVLFAQAAWLLRKGDGLFYLRWIDCINLARLTARRNGRPTMGDDEQHLLDFMAIHWARVAE